jgi:hypothetical protein
MCFLICKAFLDIMICFLNLDRERDAPSKGAALLLFDRRLQVVREPLGWRPIVVFSPHLHRLPMSRMA